MKPTIKQLKQCTPENQRELFDNADIDDIHAIIEGKRVRAKDHIVEYAKSALRRREDIKREQEVQRTEAHQTCLTRKSSCATVIAAIAGAIAGSVVTYLLTK